MLCSVSIRATAHAAVKNVAVAGVGYQEDWSTSRAYWLWKLFVSGRQPAAD